MADVFPETFPPEWEVSSPKLFTETPTSRIIMVRLENGEQAVIKQLTPVGIQEELRGAHYLDWHGGNGCVRLLALQDNNLLLEYGGKRTLLDHLNENGDEAATSIYVDVMTRLIAKPYEAAENPHDFVQLREQYSSLFKKAEADRKKGIDSLFVEVAPIADRLLSDHSHTQLLHGDIHHENILHSKRGWLVIDPKGLIGDPMYDTANMFYNPLDRDDLRQSESRIAKMAQTFSLAFGRDIKTILGFGMTHAGLSASWHDEDENFDESKRSLGVAEAIRRVLQTI
ncbi:aminoglycoside phosphotransferase family protein [Candidatus Phyllobacterium onerii]|uniref:aminoglycoside phosphotransferase family protein n=1 Tax=Candidatus Phyllobacterium onerii TaxID=3020828 RepID=UPI0023304234|nr:aminoglycoside phosphotransferase family protein [Phyllobacterium sp. IY22]